MRRGRAMHLPVRHFLMILVIQVTSTVGCSTQVHSDPRDPSYAVAEWTSATAGDPDSLFTLRFEGRNRTELLSVAADKPKGSAYQIVVQNLAPNTIYSFKLKCEKTTEPGTLGQTVYYMTPVEFMPPAPTDIRVTDVKQNFTQMKISWNISEELLYPFTGYRLHIQDQKLTSRDILIAPNQTSTLVGNLQPATKYFGELFLTNRYGKVSRSLPFTFMTRDVPRPSPVRNVKVVGDTKDLSRAFITWDPPLQPDKHIWYLVWYDLANEGVNCTDRTKLKPALRVPGTDPGRPAIATDLQPDSILVITVQAINSNGYDSLSKPVYYRTPADFSPSIPRSLKALNTSGGYQLSWLGPEIQNGRITGYEVSWEMTNRRKVSESVIDTKITLQLASNKTYFVAVVAKNSHGFTSKAASVVIETPSVINNFFHNMSVIPISQTSLGVQWGASPGMASIVVYGTASTWRTKPAILSNWHSIHCTLHGRAKEIMLRLRLPIQSSCLYVTYSNSNPNGTVTVDSLQPDTIYAFMILQVKMLFYPRPQTILKQSEVLYGKTSRYILNPVKDVRVYIIGSQDNGQLQAKVTWTAPSPFYPAGTYYEVDYQTVQGGQKKKKSTHRRKLTLTQLTKGAIYFLHVITCHRDVWGEVAYSDPIKFKVTTET